MTVGGSLYFTGYEKPRLAAEGCYPAVKLEASLVDVLLQLDKPYQVVYGTLKKGVS